MIRTITSEKIPIKLWLEEIDSDTLEQARNLANLPFTHHHVAVMPDAHVGYGMPIGGVAATRGVVIPNAVGVDIGCGVCARDCPTDAIVMEGKLPKLEESACVGCCACFNNCPTDAWVLRRFAPKYYYRLGGRGAKTVGQET